MRNLLRGDTFVRRERCLGAHIVVGILLGIELLPGRVISTFHLPQCLGVQSCLGGQPTVERATVTSASHFAEAAADRVRAHHWESDR